MSYILEALKKSQQERELGRVPTLDTSGIFDDDKETAPSSHWGLLAVGLAAVAVMIALYAVLRSPAPAPVALPASVAESSAVTESAPTPSRTEPSEISPDVLPPRAASAEPLVEPPPKPAVAPTPPPSVARTPPGPGFDPMMIDDDELAYQPDLDPWLEQELQRQLDAEQAMYSEPPAPPRRPNRAPVPADLVEDIESFKQQVRREQGIPPPPAQRQPANIRGDPTKLRLTPQQQAQLPAYFMTVHVFDEDVSKRFILINALRYTEGEETREGILVERIIPEGAVLSYLGNPFFVRR
jgi:general secretion pathway protein B